MARKDPGRTITFTRRNGLTYTKSTTGNSGTWRRTATSNRTYYPRQENVDEVYCYIGTFDRPFTMSEVMSAEELNIGKNTIHHCLVTLEQDGKIEKVEGKTKKSKYIVVTDGKESTVELDETVTQEGEDGESQGQS